MATDKNLDKLIVNKLTMEQYQGITPSDEELYFVTDEAEGFPSQATGDAGKALLAVGDGSVEWGSVASLASANEWTGSNTFKNNQTIASTYYLNCDTINSSATGNSMLRMYYDTDGAYKVLVGTVYRQATILGSTDRPYYAKDGEAFQAHELALKSDVPTDYVTATTAQTISGSKIFSGALTTGTISPSVTGSYSLGTSSLVWSAVYAKTMTLSSGEAATKITLTNNYISSEICLSGYEWRIGKDTLDANTAFYGKLIPGKTNNYDIGNSSKLWSNIYLSGGLSNGTSTVSVNDLINLVAYARKQGWIS